MRSVAFVLLALLLRKSFVCLSFRVVGSCSCRQEDLVPLIVTKDILQLSWAESST